MQEVKFTIDRSLLPEHTDEEFEEWVKYELGYIGSIDLKNPMAMEDLEVESVQFD